MPTVFEVDLPEISPFDAAYEADPHAINAKVREDSWVARTPFGIEITRYSEVQMVLRDRRFQMPVGLGLSLQGITSGKIWDRTSNGILSLDGERHTRLRRLVAQGFTPRATDRLRPYMRDVINELVHTVSPRGECDLVADITEQYPIPIICALLGAPREDWKLFSSWTDDIFLIFNFNVVADTPVIERAMDELDEYLNAMIERRRSTPADDLLTDLIAAEDAGDRLTHEELLSLVSAVLLAGTDTTRNQLAATVQLFCDHPEQWALLGQQPELAPRVVEEAMRYFPIIFGTVRVTREDVELNGLTIPAGTMVSVSTAAANRDPRTFGDGAASFDITREQPAPHFTFGGGIHYCLGAQLAKAELAEALPILARRLPGIVRTGDAPWKPVMGISGPRSLPVRFEAGH
jgi:cytochrome P450